MSDILTNLLLNYPVPVRPIIRTAMRRKDTEVLQMLINHSLTQPHPQFSFEKIFQQALIYSKVKFFLAQWEPKYKLTEPIAARTWLMVLARMHSSRNCTIDSAGVQEFLKRVIDPQYTTLLVSKEHLVNWCLEVAQPAVAVPVIKYFLAQKYQPTEKQMPQLQALGFSYHDIIACSTTSS